MTVKIFHKIQSVSLNWGSTVKKEILYIVLLALCLIFVLDSGSKGEAFSLAQIEVLCTLIFFLISLRSWNYGLTSLRELSESYGDGKFKVRVKEVGPESIRSLIRNQHKMASTIDNLLTKQKMIYARLPHDIRTPLSAIQLTSDMLVSHQGKDEFLLDRLSAQVCSLNNLCESSLHLFKLLNKEVVISKSIINFTDVLDVSMLTFNSRKKIELFNCNKMICSDAKLLNVLFLNVLSNAEQYANEKIIISFSSYPRLDVVRVKDDGKGFTSQLISTFNNGDVTNILSENGFGIGLVLIFELTKLLDGQVVLDNHGGGGRVTIVMNH